MIVVELHKMGVKVVTTVSNQHTSNMSAVKILNEATKGKYLKKKA